MIVAPTHELVDQIARVTFSSRRIPLFHPLIPVLKVAETLARGTCVRVSVASGNLDSKQQRQQLNRGCDVLVASKGRALQLVQQGTVSLESTETLCFDEADVLLQGEGLHELAQLISACPSNAQLLMFSATFHPARYALARDELLPPDFVDLRVGRAGKIAGNVEQMFFLADNHDDKLLFLEHILRRKQRSAAGGTIVFVNTRLLANSLTQHLISHSFAATSMHGDLVAEERRENLRLFSKGHCEVLVATGAFGRGLDLPCINHVINFDFPHTADQCAFPLPSHSLPQRRVLFITR
jgi:ATP-dependent RNA helicase DDX3X